MTFNKGWTITPPGRTTDAHPWLSIRIFEAATVAGPWGVGSPIDTVTWPDATPSSPDTIDIETSNAALELGWYLFELVDDTGAATRIGPVFDVASAWAPTPGDIAALMPRTTRTRLLSPGAGAEQFEFSTDTDPTLATVERYIQQACEEVVARTGSALDRIAERGSLARRAAAWHVVMLICSASASGRLADEDGSVQTATREYVGNLTELQSQLRRVAPGVV